MTGQQQYTSKRRGESNKLNTNGANESKHIGHFDKPVKVQSSRHSTIRHFGFFLLVVCTIVGGFVMAIWPVVATYYHVSKADLPGWAIEKVFIMEEAYGLAIFLVYQTMRISFRTRRWKWFHERIFAKWWWRDCWYNSVQVVFQNEESRRLLATPKSGTLFCVHPHGLYSMGIMNLVCSDEAVHSGDLKALISVNMLWIPFFADILEWAGCRSTRKSTFHMLMKQRDTLALVPGGFHEAGMHQFNKNVLYVSSGFIKFALEYGYSIVPCFVFGENKTCSMLFQFPELFRRTVGDMELPNVGAFYTKYGLVPERDVDLVTVVGDPIHIPKVDGKPTSEQVHSYQELYINEMCKLFEANNPRYGTSDSPLMVYSRERKGTSYNRVR